MTGLALAISLLWVLPGICWALDVPLESALLVGGQPVGFNVSHRRQIRSEKAGDIIVCDPDAQYKPRGKNYCCNRCVTGNRVSKHCKGQGDTTECTPCETGTFMNDSNSRTSCHECRSCLPQLHQVELSNCTQKKDAVCGCPDGRFKKYSGENFKCLECNKCTNGRVHEKCHDDKDTFCACFYGYFLHEETKICHPCKECDNPDCQVHCPPSVEKPPEKKIAAIVAGISFAAAFLGATVLIWMKRKRITSYLQQKTCPPAPVIEGTILNIPLMETNDSMPTSTQQQKLPGYTPCATDNPYVVQQNIQSSSTVVLPDVTLQTTAPPMLTPNDLYKIIKCIPVNRWTEFVRLLGLDRHTIETTERDYKHFHEAQYVMLDHWVSRMGTSGATLEALIYVLRDMDLGGCAESIEMSLRH